MHHFWDLVFWAQELTDKQTNEQSQIHRVLEWLSKNQNDLVPIISFQVDILEPT